MNTFEKALQEMARELLPNVSSEDDKKILSQLRKLYRIDREEFHQKLKRINVVRKSEGLEEIFPNEIMKGYTKKAIKNRIKNNKAEEKSKREAGYKGLSFKKERKRNSYTVGIKYFSKEEPLTLYYEGKQAGSFYLINNNKLVVNSSLKNKTIDNKTTVFPEIDEKIIWDYFDELGINIIFKIKKM